MKKYEAVFKLIKFSFEASDPKTALRVATAYRDATFPGQRFTLIQIGL